MCAAKRSAELLSRLPPCDLVGAEIGIYKGKMSATLLKDQRITLYMVDSWLCVPGYEDQGFTEEAQAKNRIDAIQRTDFAKDRRIILHMDSEVAAMTVPDESLDFVFIDADHSYDGVKKDIKSWMPKLKRGGLISGHDYDNPSEKKGKEVKRAVDDCVLDNGWKLCVGLESTWFVRMPE